MIYDPDIAFSTKKLFLGHCDLGSAAFNAIVTTFVFTVYLTQIILVIKITLQLLWAMV